MEILLCNHEESPIEVKVVWFKGLVMCLTVKTVIFWLLFNKLVNFKFRGKIVVSKSLRIKSNCFLISNKFY
jgi:hypothetical protein